MIITNKPDLKSLVGRAIDTDRSKIIEFGQSILETPELGFKEIETAKLVAQAFRELGLAPREQIGITGVKAVAKAQFAETNPSGRIVKPGDVAGVVVAMLADAPKYKTGEAVLVDSGGHTQKVQMPQAV